jgi:hypothetical protein
MRRFVAVAVGALASAFASVASADTAASGCVRSFDRAQELRDQGALVEASQEATACAASSCPKPLQLDCTQLAEQLKARVPSIVVSVQAPTGTDLPDATVELDGKIKLGLDGRPVPVNPGAHRLRVSRTGYETRTESVLVLEGQRGRIIPLKLQPTAESPKVLPEPVRWPAYAGFGLAVPALGSFAVFGLGGRADADALKQECGISRSCQQSDIDDARSKLLVADISLGIALAAAAFGVTWLVLHPTVESTRTTASGR